MRIQIRYESDVLGNEVFWTGEHNDIDSIRNICAQMAAKKLFKTGQPQREGMWIAEEIDGAGTVVVPARGMHVSKILEA